MNKFNFYLAVIGLFIFAGLIQYVFRSVTVVVGVTSAIGLVWLVVGIIKGWRAKWQDGFKSLRIASSDVWWSLGLGFIGGMISPGYGGVAGLFAGIVISMWLRIPNKV